METLIQKKGLKAGKTFDEVREGNTMIHIKKKTEEKMDITWKYLFTLLC